jgi:hypothetical protein
MIRPVWSFRVGYAIFVSFACGAFALPAYAQKAMVHAGDGQARLVIDKFNWDKDPDELRTFQTLRKGDQAVGPDVDSILDHGAIWYAYRFTHTEFQHPRSASKGMQELRKEAEDQILDPNVPSKQLNAQQQAFKDAFEKRFVQRLHEVIKNPAAIARLNAAMVLAKLAKTGQEDAADVLIEVITDPKENDGIKLYAFRGVRDFFALGRGDNPSPFKNKEKAAQYIQVLLDYLKNKRDVKGWADEQLAAIPFVRSQAIEALGQTRLPAAAITNEKTKTTTIERPTALQLLRIVRKEGLQPEPDLAEQVAATIALCQLEYRLCAEYQPDYAAALVGRFIAEFADRYNREKEGKRYPWKILALRLSKALNDWNTDLTGPPKSPSAVYVANMIEHADRLLRDVADGRQPDPNALVTWLEQNQPKDNTLFKGMANSVVAAQ